LRFIHRWLGFSLFPRNDFRTVRNDELKLLYAMVKKKKVSPIKFMMTQWAEIPGLKGAVGCTSLITRIAKNLGLLENASVTYINISRWIIDYGYFYHAHMLKKGKDGKIVMMYMDYTNGFLLPDRNLGLYAVDSFVFDLQRKEKAPRRSASARITHNPNPRYRGDDPAPEGPTFTSYTGFEQAGPFSGAPSSACRRTSRDLPVCTNLDMLGGSNLPCIIWRVPGIRARARNGKTATLTTTSNSSMRRFPVASREDACPSLLAASMTTPQVQMIITWAIIHRPWDIMSSR
jgi:hypothetical protein